jgi:hypothetical protein
MQVNNTDSRHVGAYMANQQMNNCPHEGRDMLTPYQIYYTTVKKIKGHYGRKRMAHSYRSGVASCRGSKGIHEKISSQHAPRG